MKKRRIGRINRVRKSLILSPKRTSHQQETLNLYEFIYLLGHS